MVRRVILGSRPSGIGIFVSSPGVDALTASGSDLLLSSDLVQMQIVQSGVFFRSSGTETISWGPFGYRPLIVIVSQNLSSYVYNNDNSAAVTITTRQGVLDGLWTTTNKPTLSSRVEWFVMRPGI